MPTIKLTYFPLPGRAEAARLCFTYGGVAFEDVRVTFEEWGQMKAGIPTDGPLYKLPSLPVLEVDGDELSQSMAVTRYAAAITGLDGKTSMDKAKVDMVLSACDDLNNANGKLFGIPKDDPAKAEEIVSGVMKTVKLNLEAVEKIMKANNDGKEWIVGDSVTAADFAVYSVWIQADMMMSPMGKKFGEGLDVPCLAALIQRVTDLPKLQDYLAKSNEIIKKMMESLG